MSPKKTDFILFCRFAAKFYEVFTPDGFPSGVFFRLVMLRLVGYNRCNNTCPKEELTWNFEF